MKFSTVDLKTERQWRSSTGYDQVRFDKLVPLFEQTYQKLFGKSLPERQADGPKAAVITSARDLLFFTLFSFKAGLTYDLLGLVVGMDGGTAKRNQQRGVTILQSMLFDNNYAPVRTFTSLAEFEHYFREHDTLLIDATEQPIQRPGDLDDQKLNYSGKKKGIR